MMRQVLLIAGLLVTLGLQACVAPGASTRITATERPAEIRAPVTILISIDGFRPDYLARGVTPNLNALAASGIQAAMRPSFPSITFPNHYTLVTGLRPDRHGIVGNRMEDARRPGQVFTMASDDPFWWSEAEPIWIAAERAGIRSATMFWPGSNVVFAGLRPHDWQAFAQAVDNRQRVDSIIDWLRRPAATRPRFLTLYFDTIDSAGHEFGPDDARTTRAVAELDGAIGRLRDQLATLGQPANLVIVADHGMAAIDPARTIRIDQMLPVTDYRVIYSGAYAAIEPQPGRATALTQALVGPHDHMQCWPKAAIPARFHYGRNARVPAIICLAQTGWLILDKPPTPDHPNTGGAHGYDPEAPEMAALFIASGPAVRAAGRVPGFDNVDVAPLLRRIIGLPADPALDGSATAFEPLLTDH